MKGLRSSLASAGLDIFHELPVGVYNESIAGSALRPLPGAATSTAVLVGNSRALWPPFRAWRLGEGSRVARDPLDTYVKLRVEEAVAHSPALAVHDVRYVYEGGARLVSFQRLSHAAGLAPLVPSCQLCVHPEFGPWIAFRCLLLLPKVAYEGETRAPLPVPSAVNLVDERIQDAVRRREWLQARDLCCQALGTQEHRYCDEQIAFHYHA